MAGPPGQITQNSRRTSLPKQKGELSAPSDRFLNRFTPGIHMPLGGRFSGLASSLNERCTFAHLFTPFRLHTFGFVSHHRSRERRITPNRRSYMHAAQACTYACMPHRPQACTYMYACGMRHAAQACAYACMPHKHRRARRPGSHTFAPLFTPARLSSRLHRPR